MSSRFSRLSPGLLSGPVKGALGHKNPGAWIVPPRLTFDQTIETTAFQGALKSDIYVSAHKEMRAILGQIFESPDSVINGISPLIYDPAIGAYQLRRDLGTDLKRHGKLRRQFKDGVKRSHKPSGFRTAILAWNRAFQTAYKQDIEKETSSRRALKTGIPMLAPQTLKLMRELDSYSGQMFEALLVFSDEIDDIRAFKDAVDQRFGGSRRLFKREPNTFSAEQLNDLKALKGYQAIIKMSQRVSDKIQSAPRAASSRRPEIRY